MNQMLELVLLQYSLICMLTGAQEQNGFRATVAALDRVGRFIVPIDRGGCQLGFNRQKSMAHFFLQVNPPLIQHDLKIIERDLRIV